MVRDFFFLTSLIFLSLQGGIAYAQNRCLENPDLREICEELTEEDNCSKEMTEFCCSCEIEWNQSLPYCEFNNSLNPTPTPSPTPTSTPVAPTPSPTATPNPDTSSATPTPLAPLPACSNNIDDDGDGLTDYPADPGCRDLLDETEFNADGPSCDNGKDDDGDGLIDSRDGGCSSVTDTTEIVDVTAEGCKISNTKSEVQSVILSGDKLVSLVKKSLGKLEKVAASSTDLDLKKNLSSSSKRSIKQMKKYIKEAKQSLESLPNEIVVCPDTVQCAHVDNTEKLAKFQSSMIGLRKVGIRALNRATRLTSISILEARAVSKKLGKKVKKTSNELIARASKIERIHTNCQNS